jgi:hypothetical protein
MFFALATFVGVLERLGLQPRLLTGYLRYQVTKD